MFLYVHLVVTCIVEQYVIYCNIHSQCYVFAMQICAQHTIAIVCCLSVCVSMTLMICGHTGWVTSKIIT